MTTHGPKRKNVWGEEVVDVYNDDGQKVGEISKTEGLFGEKTKYTKLETISYSPPDTNLRRASENIVDFFQSNESNFFLSGAIIGGITGLIIGFNIAGVGGSILFGIIGLILGAIIISFISFVIGQIVAGIIEFIIPILIIVISIGAIFIFWGTGK